MFDLTLIVIVRAMHIFAGVIWAGATFTMAWAVLPAALSQPAPGFGIVARRVGMISTIAALIAVLSGIYLFAALHAHDESAGARVLGAGAVTAILALGIGLLVGRPTGRKLGQLQQRNDAAAAAEIDKLRRRATLVSRATAGLLALSVIAMATFRFASAL
jgi:uncharacterized membrane protein